MVLSRGDEDQEDKEILIPEEYNELSEAEGKLKKKVFIAVHHWMDHLVQQIWPFHVQELLKLPTILAIILDKQCENEQVMEQWCLLVLHMCNVSMLGLAGMREASNGHITPHIQKMALLHGHSAYLRALTDLVLQKITQHD